MPDKRANEYDPDAYRMTVGDHLEALRTRLLLGLVGLIVALVACFFFGERVIAIFVRPLMVALQDANIAPNVNYTDAAEPFVVYMKISFISAMVLAGPWMLYQLWQFVAAGLYPAERKVVTGYLPLSIGLLIAGELMLYYFILPISLKFFFVFGTGLPIRMPATPYGHTLPTSQPAMVIPQYHGDPPDPLVDGQMWLDVDERRPKYFFNGEKHAIQTGPIQGATPIITLGVYIEMVVGLLIAFGLAFQLPLVVLALVTVGILDLEILRKARRVVYLILAILAAVIVPDVITGMLGLLVPLILLYEFGIFLAAWKKPKSLSQPGDEVQDDNEQP